MKKVSAIFVLLFCLSNQFLIANPNSIYSASSIPEDLKENAHTVVRYEKMTFDVKNVHKVEVRLKTVITILDKRSRANKIRESYDQAFETLDLKNIKIYDANGKVIRKIKSKEVSDHSSYSSSVFDDGRYKFVDASHNEYPYTIEYEYLKTSTMTMFYPTWFFANFEKSTEKSVIEIITPTDIKVRYQVNNIDVEVSENIVEGKRVYFASAENIKALVEEPMQPKFGSVIPHIRFAPDKFGLGGYEGDMSSWKSLGQFNYELNKGRDELSKEMAEKVYELTANAFTKEEKIEVLYRYLQENMRYVSIQLGVGGWQTFDAKYVEKNKYGDCKALTNFMKSMLLEADVEAYAALIYRGSKMFDIDKDFSCTNFNHVVLYVPDENEGIWLECTSTDLPPGVLGSDNENRYSLLIKPDGGELVKTPVSVANDNLLHSNIQMTIAQDGKANIAVDQKATGQQERRYRYFAFNESDEEIKKDFQNRLSLPSFKISELELMPSKTAAETQISLSLEVPKYASRGGKRLFISPNPINRITSVPREMSDRKLPISRKYAYMDIDVVTINIPNGYAVENIPHQDLSIETEFGKYSIKVEQKEQQLIYTRTMESKAFTLPKERYEDYRQFIKSVVKADKMKIVLVRNQP